MKITAEITLYPLQADYASVIKGYLTKLQAQPDVTVQTNAVSTQLFGEYDAVMNAVQQATREVFEQSEGLAALVCKFLSTDRSTSSYHQS